METLILLVLCSSPVFISLPPASAKLAAVIKDDQTLPAAPPNVACSMCYYCNNPCLPLPSPPPPVIALSAAAAAPPTPNLPIYYYSPPPPTSWQPSGGSVYAPPLQPDVGGGSICGSCNAYGGSGYQTPPPPNPILPYYPFYFYSPPLAGESAGNRRWMPLRYCSPVLLLFLAFFFS
ncbi:extensin-2-like [Phalaenopsis equestris]|uniref:extensin-2-like n=1 Tax=Phalaenopsis equestris TaxID=78828 RepID=UPI0009E20F6A|nr:extensin-2-like [Phalaenopsis equestris]